MKFRDNSRTPFDGHADSARQGASLDRTAIDLLARQVREMDRLVREPGGVAAVVRDLEFFDQWAAEMKATRLYGITAWEAGVLECLVISSGTYVYTPDSTRDTLSAYMASRPAFPGVPKHWLHTGGPLGEDERLIVKSGRSLDNRMRDFAEKVLRFKPRGVLFYLKTIPKTEYGFSGLQTAAYSHSTLSAGKQQGQAKPLVRFGRAK